jgi:mono/diheme cytochrome c family protein
MRLGPTTLIGIVCLSGAAAIAGLWIYWPGRTRYAAETLRIGHSIYQQHCAACHGAKLEGQPNWQTPLPNGRLPAPPHDASGHTWHHSDRVLFEITKNGTAAVVGGDYDGDMRGFGSVLSDDQIRAVLAFIKSSWPERERQYQEGMSRRDTGRAGSGETQRTD